MGESLPDCPIDPIDRSAMRDFLARQEELATKQAERDAKTFGERVFRSGDLRHTIQRLKRELAAAQSLHPDLFTTENIHVYKEWTDALGD
jgi:hypothetical protein